MSEKTEHLGAPTSTIKPESLAETLPSEHTKPTTAQLPTISLGDQNADLEVVMLLGEGGMGRVELARQHSLGREVAIKSVKPEKRTQKSGESLLREALFAGGLEHPNIVPVHAVGLNEEGSPVMVMKRVEGVSWRELLRANEHPLLGEGEPLLRHIEILQQVCNAAHFAHSRGVLHRDIKPENVMVGHFGEVYLVDWGVALRLSEQAQSKGIAGTPAYMAPEMANGSKLSAQTDVYLLGASLYEVINKRPPHSGENVQQALMSAAYGDPPVFGEEIPKELAEICTKALRRFPEERFESALLLREALSLFLRHQASVRLTKEALSRLQEARALPLEEARRVLRKLLVESRFGLQQALREWPENMPAREGATQCIERLISLEISEKNVSAAEHLSAELKTPNEALQKALQELKDQLIKEEETRQRLAAMEREQDLKVSMRPRVILSGVVAVLNLLITIYFAWQVSRGGFQFTLEEMLSVSIGLTILVSLVFLIGRRAFFKNQVNRGISIGVICVMYSMTLHRWMSLYLVRPVEQTFTEELFFIGVAMLMAGALLLRVLLLLGAISLGVSFLSVFYPAYASVLMGFVLGLPFVVLGLIWGRPTKTIQKT